MGSLNQHPRARPAERPPDYAFFVPTDSSGARARLEGTFERHTWSKRDADHLIAEGVALTRNSDGTATEVSFVAQAVELRG